MVSWEIKTVQRYKCSSKTAVIHVEDNSKPHGIVIYTDDSVTGDQSGLLGFTVKQDGRTVQGESSAWRVMTFSLTMEVETVKHAEQWLASHSDTKIVQWICCKRWDLGWAALTGTQPCRLFGFKSHWGSTALVIHSEWMGRQTGKHSKHDIWFSAWQGRWCSRGLMNSVNRDRPERHSFNRLTERGVEKRSGDILPSEVGNNLCSTRQALALFRGRPREDCWETGRSAYGPFRALQCHLEEKLKLKLNCHARFWENERAATYGIQRE